MLSSAHWSRTALDQSRVRVADGGHIVDHVDIGLAAGVDEVMAPAALDERRMRVVVLLHAGEGRVTAPRAAHPGRRSGRRVRFRRAVDGSGLSRRHESVGTGSHERWRAVTGDTGQLNGQCLRRPRSGRLRRPRRGTAPECDQPVEPDVHPFGERAPTRRPPVGAGRRRGRAPRCRRERARSRPGRRSVWARADSGTERVSRNSP